MTPGGETDDRYSVKCTPEMPLDGGFANVSKAFCVLGIANVVMEDAGRYSCQVESSNRSIQAVRTQVGVQVYRETREKKNETFAVIHVFFLQKNLSSILLSQIVKRLTSTKPIASY